MEVFATLWNTCQDSHHLYVQVVNNVEKGGINCLLLDKESLLKTAGYTVVHHASLNILGFADDPALFSHRTFLSRT